MCCTLQTHVKVIAIICIIFAALSIIGTIWKVTGFGRQRPETNLYDQQQQQDISLGQHAQNLAYTVGIGVSYGVISLFSAVSCLIGIRYNNKCHLIPFMIEKSFKILLCSGLGIYCIYLSIHDTWILVIACLIELGFSIYCLIIVVKYYKEISSRMISGYSPGVVFDRNNPTPIVKQGQGHSMVYVPPGSEYHEAMNQRELV